MLRSDWLFSVATNKQDEEYILNNVPSYQREQVNDNEAGDENDDLSEIGTDLESQESPAKEFDLAGSFIL